jgi:hypothetical protein
VSVAIEELAAAEVAAAADELAQLLLDAHASGMALGLSAPLTAERAADEWRATAAVERARGMGLTLLWLSTHADTDSDRVYERLGWTRMGVMPGFATNPDGAIVGNVFYYLEL